MAFHGTLQAGPRTGRCWCHLQLCPGHSRLCLAVTKDRSSWPRGGSTPGWSLFLGWEPPQGRCVQCLPGHRSTCVQLTHLECSHPARASSHCCSLSLSPPLVFPESLWEEQTGARGVSSWAVAPLPQLPGQSVALAEHPSAVGPGKAELLPAFYSALKSLLQSNCSGSFLAGGPVLSLCAIL